MFLQRYVLNVYDSVKLPTKVLQLLNELNCSGEWYVYMSMRLLKVAEHSFWYLVSFTISSKTLDPLVAKKWQWAS